MKKSGKPAGRKTQGEGKQERRRARSERLPESDQNPWYFSTEEELLSC